MRAQLFCERAPVAQWIERVFDRNRGCGFESRQGHARHNLKEDLIHNLSGVFRI